ncbi:Glycoside hydrolase, family 20, catalytic core [Beutenbergia cavernae DSM 12333]|uniref:beta-N-acetylhexosaminidase n=1 Tax=Beutenbergia cavernae (strain ATCC BAA-8 / DSM 12333 / CCUG 43141 / JCM 11478 / NBRC 16432 / NCIMB 13614 / HKI 0122) TaxID=471853 RepID=C5BZV7_BEUC1|nr:glycoside hydrolase family 20 zincin-like fold domain-containing protein [Beutenbergia cavernae]ACQ81287.1 Glycoside hydrolase, family 20, catalytic core [Beutenbergia cavernae DSM 12333]
MAAGLNSLFPRPRSITSLDGDDVPAGVVAVETPDASLPPQGYVLRVADGEVRLAYADDAGRRYGRATLAQLAAGGEALPAVEITDWPDLPDRGFMLDVSRDRVPTRETLTRILDLLEAARYTQLQLYTEHTFAYAGHEEVWADASPLTPDDVRWLDASCAARGIELVPNQNVFGHMERWLAHDTYADRAESPGGYTLAGSVRKPAVLEPTADNAAFALGLLEELLPNFSSRRVNIGADETFELGLGRSRDRVAAEGRGAVYVEYVQRILGPLVERGYEVQYWADVLAHHPEYAAALGGVPIVWLYDSPSAIERALDLPAATKERMAAFDASPEQQLGGFATRGAAVIAAGIPFWVAPGTGTWQSIVGRLDNARENILDAATTALAHGGTGFLLTQWGDHGMVEPPPVAFAPLLYGGAVAWCSAANADLDLATTTAELAFGDATHRTGDALVRLGTLGTDLGMPALNATLLFASLFPGRSGMVTTDGLTADAVERVLGTIDAQLASLDLATPQGPDADLVLAELQHAARLARFGARVLLADVGGGALPSVAELDDLLVTQRELWLARSRPGGLSDSLAKFGPLREKLAAG